MIHVHFQRGLFLPQHSLWLDPATPQELAFVSHAHSDHIAPHQAIIASHGTANLLRTRLPTPRTEHTLSFHKPFQLNSCSIRILPAGHVFGSSQLWMEAAEGSLLYTGDFKLRPSPCAEPTQWLHAETLVMETTFGLPRYRFPPTHETLTRIVEFCADALEQQAVPILLAYPLGKAQHILCALIDAGLRPVLHPAVHTVTEVYRQHLPGFPSAYDRLSTSNIAGRVLICPPGAARSAMLRRIPNRRTAILSGWALDPGACQRFQTDAAFPLSDHADYDELLRYVELVRPQRVLTLHGFAAAFASDLRARGIEAWAINQDNQLDLIPNWQPARETKLTPPLSPSTDHTPAAPTPPDHFLRLAALCAQLASTQQRSLKLTLLSNYLQALEEAPLATAATYLSGHAFSDRRPLHAGWPVIQRALLQSSQCGEKRLHEIFHHHRNPSDTAFNALQHATLPQPLTLLESNTFLLQLEKARSPLNKAALLAQHFRRLTPSEAAFLVRILIGSPHTGLDATLLEDAIARTFHVPPDAVRTTHKLLGDIAQTARLAKNQSLHDATPQPWRPVQCMRATPEPSAHSLWERITPGSRWWMEPQFDGIRVQLHIAPGRAELFDSNLRSLTTEFTDLLSHFHSSAHSAVLDGELLALDDHDDPDFNALQRRLVQHPPSDLFSPPSKARLRFMAFDLLHLDGESLLHKPLKTRRSLLESLHLPACAQSTPVHAVQSLDELHLALGKARAAGQEGLVVKDSHSSYTPGKRNFAWLKLKPHQNALHMVVFAATRGLKSRSHLLQNYTLALRDDETGAFVPVGKTHSGLTDEDLIELTAHLHKSPLGENRRTCHVRPEVVFEVTFASVQSNNLHPSGISLRLPRIHRIRRDKTSADIDSLSTARQFVSQTHPPQSTKPLGPP